jgi:undecaprenyl diphosphate synthase
MHVAIIMDGNGRWASQRRLPRTAGHRMGARAVNATVEAAARHGVATLTLYAFSAANWNRPSSEVSALLALFKRHLLTQTERCLRNGIRLNVIGRRDRLPETLRASIEAGEAATAHCRGMWLRIAVDYSAQHSVMEACKRLRAEPDGAVPRIDSQRFKQLLGSVDHSAAPAPDVDLLIRTGGEKRLSDFLLWESAYAELHFLECLWPDFSEPLFLQALEEFTRRDRRYGRIASA